MLDAELEPTQLEEHVPGCGVAAEDEELGPTQLEEHIS